MEKGELEKSGNIPPKNCKPDNPVAIFFLYRVSKDRGKKPIRLPGVSQKSQQIPWLLSFKFRVNLQVLSANPLYLIIITLWIALSFGIVKRDKTSH
jgi:hypothetical protein